MSNFLQLSSNLLYAAFVFYLIAIFFFAGAIRDKKGREDVTGNESLGKYRNFCGNR